MKMFRYILALLLCLPCAAQLSQPLGAPVFRALDANGKPLAGGQLYSYVAGSTTPQATFADANRVTPNANPTVLDASGQAQIFLGQAVYKFVLQDANGVQQWTIDNINGNPASGSVASVYGRTGPVAAMTGDYTCTQITGAVCSSPTLYYQNIASSGAVVSTQRSTLNFIGGTGLAITAADNTQTANTDVTVMLTGTSTPRTCNQNGCYTIATDGTITQWGRTACSASGAECQIVVTFPYPFTSTSNLAITISPGNTGSGTGNLTASVNGSPTATQFTAELAALVEVGGAGDNLTHSPAIYWMAKGN